MNSDTCPSQKQETWAPWLCSEKNTEKKCASSDSVIQPNCAEEHTFRPQDRLAHSESSQKVPSQPAFDVLKPLPEQEPTINILTCRTNCVRSGRISTIRHMCQQPLKN